MAFTMHCKLIPQCYDAWPIRDEVLPPPPPGPIPSPPSGPDRLVRETQFLNRAARPHENLMVVQLLETATGQRYTRTVYRAWQGL